jgi:hypothetical protein
MCLDAEGSPRRTTSRYRLEAESDTRDDTFVKISAMTSPVVSTLVLSREKRATQKSQAGISVSWDYIFAIKIRSLSQLIMPKR